MFLLKEKEKRPKKKNWNSGFGFVGPNEAVS